MWASLIISMMLGCATGRRAQGDRYLQEGRYPAAARAYEDVLERRPANKRALLGHAHALLASSRPEQAIFSARAASEAGLPEGHALYAEVLIRTGDAASALALLAEPEKIPNGHRLLAEALLATGDASGAMAAALQTSDRALLAWCALRSGQPGTAESAAQAALASTPSDTNTRAELAGVLLTLGIDVIVEIPDASVQRWWTDAVRLQASGDAEGALRMLSRLAVSRPEDASYSAALGMLWLQLEEHEFARRALEDALDLDPEQPSAWVSLALACTVLEKFDCAGSAWENRIRHGEPLENNWMLAGEAWDRTSDVRRQVTFWMSAVRVNPRDATMTLMLSKAHQRSGDLDMAVGYGRRAQQLAPTDAEVILHLVEVIRQRGDEGDEVRSLLSIGRQAHPQDRRFRTGR
jgi:tetratricopeptide (TPR) repeat protein